jgi:peptide/nickel transport system permease protein
MSALAPDINSQQLLAAVTRRRSTFRLTFVAGAALSVIALVILVGALASFLAPANPTTQVLSDRLTPPGSPGHLLGTDALGRDELSRLMFGARASMLVALSAVLVAGTVGVALGLVGGYLGGTADAIIMRFADIQLSIPYLVLAIAIVAVLGTSSINLVLVLGLVGWVFYARVVRAEVLSVKQREYVEAARAIGTPDWRIVLRHVLPNVRASVIVMATLETPRMILSEAALSFLGLGIQPPTPSWGNMVADGRDYLANAWWLTTIPGLAIVTFAVAVSVLGDWLRDVLDPRLSTMR